MPEYTLIDTKTLNMIKTVFGHIMGNNALKKKWLTADEFKKQTGLSNWQLNSLRRNHPELYKYNEVEKGGEKKKVHFRYDINKYFEMEKEGLL